jgi:hypothetical protein
MHCVCDIVKKHALFIRYMYIVVTIMHWSNTNHYPQSRAKLAAKGTNRGCERCSSGTDALLWCMALSHHLLSYCLASGGGGLADKRRAAEQPLLLCRAFSSASGAALAGLGLRLCLRHPAGAAGKRRTFHRARRRAWLARARDLFFAAARQKQGAKCAETGRPTAAGGAKAAARAEAPRGLFREESLPQASPGWWPKRCRQWWM